MSLASHDRCNVCVSRVPRDTADLNISREMGLPNFYQFVKTVNRRSSITNFQFPYPHCGGVMSKQQIRRRGAILAACALGISAGISSWASAQVVIDGTKDAGYAAANAVQTNNTGFGDNTATDGNTA